MILSLVWILQSLCAEGVRLCDGLKGFCIMLLSSPCRCAPYDSTIFCITSRGSQEGSSTGNNEVWKPRTLKASVSPLRTRRSSQQTGQHNFDTAIFLRSKFCTSCQHGKHYLMLGILHLDQTMHFLWQIQIVIWVFRKRCQSGFTVHVASKN